MRGGANLFWTEETSQLGGKQKFAAFRPNVGVEDRVTYSPETSSI